MDENCVIIDAQNYLCREITTGNIPPIQEEGINIISNAEVSHSNTLLNTIVPLTSLSLCCLLLGLCFQARLLGQVCGCINNQWDRYVFSRLVPES